MPLFLLDIFENISAFFTRGGPVLIVIAVVTFILWSLIFERIFYFNGQYKRDFNKALSDWEGREERRSWGAHVIREKIISETRLKINQNMDMIKTLIAVCPFFGLLGTVTGMIEVFSALAITGGGDAKAMAGGVSRATVPTMAGMVVALSGVFANMYLTSVNRRENSLINERLTMDH